jgi:predicted esterase
MNRLPEGKRSYDNIYIAGFSMGAAAAVATHSKWDKPIPLTGIFAASAWNPFPLKDFA